MKLKEFKHIDVNKDGTCRSGGAVGIKGGISIIKGTCELEYCKCSEGFFIVVTKPLKDRVVEGFNIEFDSLEELETYMKLLGINDE